MKRQNLFDEDDKLEASYKAAMEAADRTAPIPDRVKRIRDRISAMNKRSHFPNRD